MSIFRSFIWPCVRAVSFAAIGQGILLWLGSQGVFPAQGVAVLIDIATNPANLEIIGLILAGVFGVSVAAIWEFVKARRKASFQASPKQTPYETRAPQARRVQTEAITDDNPTGTWETVYGNGDPNLALYAAWDGVDPLTMEQASFLWVGEHPIDARYLSGWGQARYITLSQAVNSGELTPTSTNMRQELKLKAGASEQLPDLEFSREALRQFIESKGLRPAPFLFPEDR